MPIYLGLDSSTQSLTATAIDINGPARAVLFERTLSFDEALPAYGTRHGVIPGDDPLVAAAPPLMWAEALDLMMAWVARSGIDLTRLRAISGSAQQHGSVYLGHGAAASLACLDSRVPLAHGLRDIFARPVAPIWMDTSTTAECAAITEEMGGPERLARLTGSRAFERFTGPQIRKFAMADPAAYARTERIHLVSSYMASLLAGRHAPVEPGDAAGMNLMDLRARRWAPAALRATASGFATMGRPRRPASPDPGAVPGLAADAGFDDLAVRLPELRESWTIVGPLAPYWVQRYGLPPAKVVAWSGDNPSSLIGVGLIREGRIAISLGTSDTVFGFMREPRVDPSGTGHVFGSPTGDFMGLTCFKNGSLARERIRDEHGLDWTQFSDALRRTPPGNHGAMMLPWFEPEITPPVLNPGVRRYRLDPQDRDADVRAVVEAQAMAMARHSRWMGIDVETIHATGGASTNREILEVLADVFDASVYQLDVGNSAALGAALRAYHADLTSEGEAVSWEHVVAGLAEPAESARIRPHPDHVRLYAELMKAYAAFEARALEAGRQ